jgi:hypothetical protein
MTGAGFCCVVCLQNPAQFTLKIDKKRAKVVWKAQISTFARFSNHAYSTIPKYN